MRIKWTNKWSGEQGFVKKLDRKNKCFENTFDIDEAKSYAEKNVNRIIDTLNNYCSDNTYQAV